MPTPTIFSRIINGEIPCYKIYEDEYSFAFLDVSPIQPGHTLVVPKIEVDYFADVPEPYYSAVFQTAKKISPAITKAMNKKRVLLSVVGFEVPHFHLHLIPGNSASVLKGKRLSLSNKENEQILERILLGLE